MKIVDYKTTRYLLLLTLLPIQATFAQYNPEIRSARPGQAVGPFTTGTNVFQIQTGITYSSTDNDNTGTTENSTEYAASLRYGLTEKFEIRSAFRVRGDQIQDAEGDTQQLGGVSFWNAGVRYNILNGSGYQPALGIQADMRLTWVDEDYKSEEIAPRLMIIYGQKLTDIFRLTTNLSVTRQTADDWIGNYVLSLSFPLGGKWSGLVENYGSFAEDGFNPKWDAGIAYLVNNDFQLDATSGFGKNDGIQDWFVDIGISWRVKFQ